MNPAIAAEEQKHEALLAAAEQASQREDEARQALVDAKVEGKPETQQKKLLQTLIERQADAAAAQAAADQQAATLQAVREKIAQQEFEQALDDVENRMGAARGKWRDHHNRLAQYLRGALGEYRYLQEARREEVIACQDYARLESGTGRADPFATMTMQRIPMGGGSLEVDFARTLDRAEAIIDGLRLRG